MFEIEMQLNEMNVLIPSEPAEPAIYCSGRSPQRPHHGSDNAVPCCAPAINER